MESIRQNFSESFKLRVVNEVLNGFLSKEEARRQYGIKGKSAILGWYRSFQRYGSCCLTLPSDMASLKTKKSVKDPATEELKARIKQLERQLEDEQLRSEAYQRMINIAEKEFNIPIRKKPGTK